MSTILATILVPAITASASSSSSVSLLRPRSNSSGGQFIRGFIADTSKRRRRASSGDTNIIQRVQSGGATNVLCGGRYSSSRVAFANPSSLFSQSRHLGTTTTNNNNNNKLVQSTSRRRDSKQHFQPPPPRLPWTPICETHELLTKPKQISSSITTTSTTALRMMMNPNLHSEGFRDAHRGGQDYLKPRGEGMDEEEGVAMMNANGAAAETMVVQEANNDQPSSPTVLPHEQHLFQQREPSQQQQQQQQQPQLKGGGYGFPKLSPGRQRNYKSPMTSASSALQQSFRRKNVVSSLERVGGGGYPAATTATEEGQQLSSMGQSMGQRQRNNSMDQLMPNWDTSSPKMEEGANINGSQNNNNMAISSPSILVEPSKSENFRDDVQRFKASGSDGYTSDQLQQQININSSSSSNNNKQGGMTTMMITPRPNSVLSAVDSSSLQAPPLQQPLSGMDSTTTSTTVGTTISSSSSTTTTQTNPNTTTSTTNNTNDPFKGKSNQYYEKLGPQMEEASVEETTLNANNNPPPPPPPTAAVDRENTIIARDGMDTSELSLDPKFIDFLPSDQVKEEEDLLLEEDNIAEGEGAEPYMSTQLLKARLHDLLEENDTGSFVKMFRGSASYIANHRGTIAVYHIPGELLAWEGFPGLMDDIALTWLLGMKIVLVAGCRHQIDLRLEEDEGEELDDRGYSGKVMMSSIRVTDEDTLRVVKEEAGFVRFEIERRLAKSLRLHGGLVKGSESLVGNVVSGNFYSAQPFGVIDGIDYCWTGFPRKVEVERIRQVHETNDIVLLTSLGVSPSGEIFNVNSEFLAATVAGAVSASKIVYFNVHGTSFQNKNTNKPVQNLRVSDAKNLLTHYNMKIHPKGFALVDMDGNSPQQQVLRTPGSMETLIKVGYSMVALEKGVKRAHILAPENGALVQELYTRDGCGTLISRDIYEGIRRADVNDVSGIYDLIDPLVRAGTLVPRPKSKLEKEITGYYVYTRDGLIVATGQLKRFEGGFAEIGCLVVNKDYRKGGRGDAMLGYLERLSLQSGARKVFVLSTQTMDWFIERGFREVSVESLPPSRQAMYNKKRKSKIYMKEIDGERDLDAAELWWSNQVSS
ncbi:hypothetical protein ACHAXM_004899 [Skeletonema potamos]